VPFERQPHYGVDARDRKAGMVLEKFSLDTSTNTALSATLLQMAELKDYMNGMAERFDGAAVPGLDATMQLIATGEGGGNWH
jgi:hypothetical protein